VGECDVLVRVALQYDDVMCWVRSMYSRRHLVFSLVEASNDDDDDDDVVAAAIIDDKTTTSRHKTSQRRRNASLKVFRRRTIAASSQSVICVGLRGLTCVCHTCTTV